MKDFSHFEYAERCLAYPMFHRYAQFLPGVDTGLPIRLSGLSEDSRARVAAVGFLICTGRFRASLAHLRRHNLFVGPFERRFIRQYCFAKGINLDSFSRENGVLLTPHIWPVLEPLLMGGAASKLVTFLNSNDVEFTDYATSRALNIARRNVCGGEEMVRILKEHSSLRGKRKREN